MEGTGWLAQRCGTGVILVTEAGVPQAGVPEAEVTALGFDEQLPLG